MDVDDIDIEEDSESKITEIPILSHPFPAQDVPLRESLIQRLIKQMNQCGRDIEHSISHRIFRHGGPLNPHNLSTLQLVFALRCTNFEIKQVDIMAMFRAQHDQSTLNHDSLEALAKSLDGRLICDGEIYEDVTEGNVRTVRCITHGKPQHNMHG